MTISTTWRPFSEARAFVHQLGLKSKDEWNEYSKSGERPPDIPSNPNTVYPTEYKGFGDWLGTGTIATSRRSYRPFAEARAFVHTLGLKNYNEWRVYCKSGKKPPDIPAIPTIPERYGSDYKGMGDWLGTGNIAPTKRVWRPFVEARSYVRNLKVKNQDAWLAYCTSGQKPADIPSDPDRTYLAEFESYGDWLGNDNIHRGKITYRPFTEARTFVRALRLKSYKQWKEYCTSGKKPSDIPSNPKGVYPSEYKDVRDWLGTERTRHYRPFTEASTFVRKLGLKSYKQWQEYCRSGKKPPDIPSDPRRRYPGEYKSIANWLGTEYLSFSEARAFVQALEPELKDHDDWLKYCRSGKKPEYIPSKPEQVYREEYKGMKDWLGVVDKWNSNTLLTFLHDLQPQLSHLTKKDLVHRLQGNGALNHFRRVLGGATPIRVINDLMKNEGRELEQALTKAMNENIQISVDGTTIETEAAKVIDTAEFFEHENSIAVSAQNEPSVPVSVLQSKTATHYFDVFLCYNSKSRTKVKKVGEQLKEEGILPWLDEWELPPGMPWQRLLEKQIGQIKSAAVFVGKDGVGPWQQLEIDGFLREFVRRKCPVIPVLLADALRKPKLPLFLAGMTWVDFRRQDVDPMGQLIWGITGKRRT